MSGLRLDRMEIEEAGPNPERLAAAIHAQLDLDAGAVPVESIAKALDIVEIRHAPLIGFEGALVMTDDRGIGAIAVNRASSRQRRNFTIAHELGHFLDLRHRPAETANGFACSRADLGRSWRGSFNARDRHVRQECEANRFAIELLAPIRLVRRHLRGIPDLERVLALSDALGLSREASARRYVELHERPCAVVFSREKQVRYFEAHAEFPALSCTKGQRLSGLLPTVDSSGLSNREEADPQNWLRNPTRQDLVVQTFAQREGYSITLLALDDRHEEEGVDDLEPFRLAR